MPKGLKTGGRKAGVPNRATAAKAAEIEASGQTSLDFMLTVMRNTDETPERRLEAAKAAAPYVHPRLAAIQHTGNDEKEIAVSRDPIETARRIAFLLAQALHHERS
jgi:hypothetical protein